MVEFLVAIAGLAAASAPVTSFGEDAATAVGAGAFLGGFTAGVIGVLLGRKETWRDRAAINGSYVGGAAMVVAMAGERLIG
ncbi:MAG TPA: hypothetical protein VHF88_07870 [Thermoleophilaceae bacterium]|nr:hypothetical protein [Thermoleophilaceae bacterium]